MKPKIKTLLLPKKYKYSVKLFCLNCNYYFKKWDWYEKADYTQFQQNTDSIVFLLKCPYCDKNWQKSAGICWKTYPQYKKAILNET